MNQTQLQEAAAGAMQVAARFLVSAMKQLVGIQGSRRVHSKPGEAPFRQSGTGQESIQVEDTATGARVGVPDIGIGVLGGNHMAMWDATGNKFSGRRPWLSQWERYKEELNRIFLSELKTRMAK